MKPDGIPPIRIQFDFKGGPHDGESVAWDNRNQTGNWFAQTFFLMTDGGQLGKEFLGVAGSELIKMGEFEPGTVPVPDYGKVMHRYRVVDRSESEDLVLITVAHVPQVGLEPQKRG
jgi:hypothetical protein